MGRDDIIKGYHLAIKHSAEEVKKWKDRIISSNDFSRSELRGLIYLLNKVEEDILKLKE